MCRWIAYRGEAVALERYVTSPVHSLIEQSRRALESTDSTNGDGFGLGWYGDREEPASPRREPGWDDEPALSLQAYRRSCSSRRAPRPARDHGPNATRSPSQMAVHARLDRQ